LSHFPPKCSGCIPLHGLVSVNCGTFPNQVNPQRILEAGTFEKFPEKEEYKREKSHSVTAKEGFNVKGPKCRIAKRSDHQDEEDAGSVSACIEILDG
jgi:hypothetical protein